MDTPRDRMHWRAVLSSSASVLALGVITAGLAPTMAMAADAAAAADTGTTAVDELVVTGLRQSLATAQLTKRDSDTVVDSISAADIGAFPDKSLAEALQRVPGITVNRFAASDDTSHFSAEPSGVLVRGLSQVRNEFNGRDTFSANSSRGLGWGDISPELLAGVDVYKNQTAEMIEGGIAGTVNIRTRAPFDSPGRVIEANVRVNYGDITKQYTPDVSAILSDRWDTSIGEIGLMLNVAHSEVQTTSEGIQYGRMAVLQDIYGPGLKYIPSSVSNRITTYDRVRNGLVVGGQWQDHDHKFLLTTQYDRSTYENTWKEHGVVSYPMDLFAKDVRFVISPTVNPEIAPLPAPGSTFSFDPSGNFENGVLTVLQCCTASGGGNSWWGVQDMPSMPSGLVVPPDQASSNIAVNSSGQAMLHPCYSWMGPTWPNGACAFPGRAPDVNAVTRFNHSRNMTEDGSIHLKWNPTDDLRVDFDVQRVHSTVKSYDVEVGQYSFANLSLDATGARPVMTLLDPTNINQSPGGLGNPNNYRYNHVMDHIEDSSGSETAARVDGEYQFHTSWLDSLKVGVRYADREQTVRYSTFNWGNIANDWNLESGQSAFWNIDNHTPSGAFKGYPQGLIDVRTFGSSFFGTAPRQFAFFNMDALAAGGANLLSYQNLGVGQDQWTPICNRAGTVGCFLPAELNQVSEKTTAAYALLKFGGPALEFGGLKFSGNIGVRYVSTDDRANGSIQNPIPFNSNITICVANPPPPPPAPAGLPNSIGCYLSAQELAFNSGGGENSTVSTTHHNWLPSFNLKVDLNDHWLVRFAASRAMSRPDFGLLKNYINIQTSLPNVSNPNDPRWIKDAAGNVTGVNPTYTADGYNPSLKPATADQFDLSLENYFGSVGYFSFTGFYKQFHDYIQYGTYNRDVTINNVTRSVLIRGPMNGDGARLAGFEVAYQRFFDFLPGIWSGLGIQANYTYIQNHGITNSNLKVASGGASGATPQPGTNGTALQVSDLEGISKHTFNIVGMYEKGPVALRLAYNWRSSFLVTAVDCCTYLPEYTESQGFMDASIRYRLTDHVELSLEGTNLLNTQTVIKQQVTDSSAGGLLAPGAWFQNDRRFVFGVRFKY